MYFSDKNLRMWLHFCGVKCNRDFIYFPKDKMKQLIALIFTFCFLICSTLGLLILTSLACHFLCYFSESSLCTLGCKPIDRDFAKYGTRNPHPSTDLLTLLRKNRYFQLLELHLFFSIFLYKSYNSVIL